MRPKESTQEDWLKNAQKKKKKEVLRLQHFYNKSWVVSYYLFKFEFSTEITFLTQQ